ncbi:MAG: SMC-Scp complex subunit ScpB [Gemmatimonadota bacterium]|jgi:segregation and condensation protein B|nr:SMC-Scp complex subunit ScpB [Gemmatimonadota bacterium]HAW90490.1 SMC-Scp complex subunit ScpB [Gemmatimonadota bacterium]
MNPTQIVEAVLFASEAPLKAEEIARADDALNEDLVEEAIQELNAVYSESERAFEIRELGEGYQLLTRADFAPYLERFDTIPRPSRLSGPALETLAIIAYRQPIGRIEMEYIRGVSSSAVIRTLQDRALIEIVARGAGLGRPLLYGTTQRFLEHFGFRSLDDLPRPEELPVILRERTPLEDLEGSKSVEPIESGEVATNEPEPDVDDVLAQEAETPPEEGEELVDAAAGQGDGNEELVDRTEDRTDQAEESAHG